jgi:hypothetical protein
MLKRHEVEILLKAGHFKAEVANASHDWVFPKQAAGQRVVATVEFALNCHDTERAP